MDLSGNTGFLQWVQKVAPHCGFYPGAPLTYFNDGGVRQRFIFYTQKNPYFFSIPKKIPQCFCISKFYYLASGTNMPTSTLVLVKNKTINCADVIFDLSWWKIQYAKKSLCCFRDPKKIPASFIGPKKSLLAKMSDPKKSFGPTRH